MESKHTLNKALTLNILQIFASTKSGVNEKNFLEKTTETRVFWLIVKLTAIKSMQIHFCHLNWPFSYYFIEKRFIYSPLNIILSVFFLWDLLLSQRWGKIGENIYRAVKSNIFKSFWYCICISSILLTNDMYDSYDS